MTNDDDPITLADAAQHFRLSKGVLKAAGLADRLVMFKLGRQYYTTPNAVREWVVACRVAAKERVSIAIPSEDNLSSAMVAASLDSAQETLARLKKSSQPTLPRSIALMRRPLPR